MNYLQRLKNLKDPEREPTKPTKGAFDGFVGRPQGPSDSAGARLEQPNGSRPPQSSSQPKTAFSPIQPGWVVAFVGGKGLIEGASVREGIFREGHWVFTLENGMKLIDTKVLSVGAVVNGMWLGAWTVKEWGLDGGRCIFPGPSEAD